MVVAPTIERNRTAEGGAARRRRWGGGALLYRYLLFVRFVLLNTVAVALLAAAYVQGWLDGLFETHLAELSGVIAVVFVYGLVLCGVKIWRHSVELNDIAAGTPDPRSRAGRYLGATTNADRQSRSMHADVLRLKLTDRIVIVRHIANSLVFLGLIGTVIGFIIALSGVDPAAATQLDSVAAMISTLISGMSLALYTTLVGAVLYLWLIVNHWTLVTGTVDLIAAIMELGEVRARA